MKITGAKLRSLIRETIYLLEKSTEYVCPPATQDADLNRNNKVKAAENTKIMYGHPKNVKVLQKLAAANKFCGNCAAFNVTEQIVDCGGASKDGKRGYCMMHEFTCAAEKTCLTWAPGGPKRV